LSFEHVPPRAAFNNRPIVAYAFNEAIKAGPESPHGGRIQQRGAGAYTLCGRCNNNTGGWYGRHYANWAHRGLDVLFRAGGDPGIINFHDLAPLPILKQIIAMFFSVNGERLQAAQPELVQFVLNREACGLNPKLRIFAYLTNSAKTRAVPVCAAADIYSGRTTLMSEVSFPPFGYLMAFDSNPPDSRLCEITHFARYGYRERTSQTLRLRVLPTHTAFPGDYRTIDETYRDRDANLRAMQKRV